MRYFWLIFVAALIFSCGENRRSARDLDLYYDLDSLLDEQVRMLADAGYSLAKTVTMSGRSEVDTAAYDSAGWAGEFRIMRDFDLNQPNNVGAYSANRSDNMVTYELTDKTFDAPVKSFSVKEEGNQLEIFSTYFEDKAIYQHERNLKLVIREGILRSFEIKGFQKMVLKDTTTYAIQGKVLKL